MGTSDPSRPEVEKQLEIILQSEVFRVAPRVAKLLKTIVTATLNATLLPEFALGIEVFGRSPDWVPAIDSIVRANTSNLRKRLKQYYDANSDAVVIDIPEGAMYEAYFSYNTRADNHQYYSAGLQHLSRGDPFRAERIFDRVSYEHPLSMAASADSRLLFAFLCNGTAAIEEPSIKGHGRLWRPFLAEDPAELALGKNPGVWQAHAALGAVFTFRHQWAKAKRAFQRAAEIDPIGLRSNPWYLIYLLATGERRQALKLAGENAAASFGRDSALLMFSFCLYLNREFGPAEAMLIHAVDHRNVYWLALNALVNLASDEPKHALKYILLCEPARIAMPLVKGITTLCYGSAGKTTEARKRLAAAQKRSDYLTLALSHLAVGETQQAMTALQRACEKRVPFTIFLHLLPVFDPIRDHDGFQTLIERMKLS
jgi:Tfp pilus assembly protein PilF